jgi:hypothetical protein
LLQGLLADARSGKKCTVATAAPSKLPGTFPRPYVFDGDFIVVVRFQVTLSVLFVAVFCVKHCLLGGRKEFCFHGTSSFRILLTSTPVRVGGASDVEVEPKWIHVHHSPSVIRITPVGVPRQNSSPTGQAGVSSFPCPQVNDVSALAGHSANH